MSDIGQGVFPDPLRQGYEAFLTGDFRRERDTFCELAAKGQHPHSMVIGCCDSRVMPEEIFAAAPGEIFDLRNVANLVPAYAPDQAHVSVWAAVEYAIETLKVRRIVILGHARCGGVRAFAAGAHKGESALSGWIGLIAPAAERMEPKGTDADYAERLARASLIHSLDNLRGHPEIARLEGAGALTLHAAYFDIESARLLILDETGGQFVPLSGESHAAALNAATGAGG